MVSIYITLRFLVTFASKPVSCPICLDITVSYLYYGNNNSELLQTFWSHININMRNTRISFLFHQAVYFIYINNFCSAIRSGGMPELCTLSDLYSMLAQLLCSCSGLTTSGNIKVIISQSRSSLNKNSLSTQLLYTWPFEVKKNN